jgi:ABC-type branched-subunit amino acid transport system substrate-binding protein
MVMANVASPNLYDRGLKYTWGTPFPVVPRWSERYFEMLSSVDPKPKTIYFITHDNPVMKGITGYWSKKAEDQGIKVIGTETFAPDTKDFTALLAKVRAAKPDILYIRCIITANSKDENQSDGRSSCDVVWNFIQTSG